MKRYSVDVVARNKQGRQLWARRCLWEGGAEDAAGALTAARDALRPLVTADADSFALTVRGPGAELVTATEYAEDVVHGDGSSAGGLLDNWQLELTPEQRSAAMAEAERKAAQAAVDLLAKPKEKPVGPFDGLQGVGEIYDLEIGGYAGVTEAIVDACIRVKQATGRYPTRVVMGADAQRAFYDERANGAQVPKDLDAVLIECNMVVDGAIVENEAADCRVYQQRDPFAWVVGSVKPKFAKGSPFVAADAKWEPLGDDPTIDGVLINGQWINEGPNVDDKQKRFDADAFRRAADLIQKNFEKAVRRESQVQEMLDNAVAEAKATQQLREEILRGSVSLQSPKAFVKTVVDADDVLIEQIRDFNLIGGEVFYVNEAGEEVHIGTVTNVNNKPGEKP